jgi:hypothetical protein
MQIGPGLTLITAGAILLWAVTWTPPLFSLQTVGLILMVTGVLTLVLPHVSLHKKKPPPPLRPVYYEYKGDQNPTPPDGFPALEDDRRVSLPAMKFFWETYMRHKVWFSLMVLIVCFAVSAAGVKFFLDSSTAPVKAPPGVKGNILQGPSEGGTPSVSSPSPSATHHHHATPAPSRTTYTYHPTPTPTRTTYHPTPTPTPTTSSATPTPTPTPTVTPTPTTTGTSGATPPGAPSVPAVQGNTPGWQAHPDPGVLPVQGL